MWLTAPRGDQLEANERLEAIALLCQTLALAVQFTSDRDRYSVAHVAGLVDTLCDATEMLMELHDPGLPRAEPFDGVRRRLGRSSQNGHPPS